MKIYWSLSSVPELASLSREEKREIWQACARKTLLNQLALVGCGVCAVVGGYLGRKFGMEPSGEGLNWADMGGAGIGAGIGAVIYTHVTIKAALPAIRVAIQRIEWKKSAGSR
jgi:uncharacterized protein YcfJ